MQSVHSTPPADWADLSVGIIIWLVDFNGMSTQLELFRELHSLYVYINIFGVVVSNKLFTQNYISSIPIKYK